MGAIYERLGRLRSAYADLTTDEKKEYREAIVAVVQRRFPALSASEAWIAFRDAGPKIQVKAIERAMADIQVAALRDTILPRLPYERTIGQFTYHVIAASVKVQDDLILRFRVRLFKDGIDVTPPEIGPGESLQYINPPVFLVDDAGEIEETFTDANGDVQSIRKTENPLRALRAMIEATLRDLVRKHKL
ncbi:MAG: hypothetical protein AAFX90_10035 [Pseudomonadota bacterium]